jgi:tetratricopeptide (TPR) repeat protein
MRVRRLCPPFAADASPYYVSDDVQAALSLLDRKNYRGALAFAEKRLKVKPDDPVALATRGNIYIELGDYEDALMDHDAVLALLDQGALVNACWARALANKDLDRARDYCDRAVRKGGGMATATESL